VAPSPPAATRPAPAEVVPSMKPSGMCMVRTYCKRVAIETEMR
jgi:hypothetical protein